MKVNKLIPRQMTDAILYVTHYKEGALSGWLDHPRLNNPEKVQSVPALLFALDGILSREDIPIGHRAFEESALPDTPIATIRLQVLFREHHTWQGCAIWEDQQMEAPFRSVLELIEILDEILAD